jgi:putative membrane protein
MAAAALVFASLAALLHAYIWSMESLTWSQPGTWKKFGLTSQEQADANALLAYNQGFYNLFLAVGTGLGVVFVVRDGDWGWPLIVFGCGCMLGAAVILASSGRAYLRGAILQGTLPLLALVLAILA